MVILLELFLFLIRVFLLLTGSFVAYVLGNDFYQSLTAFGPCRGVVAVLIGYIPVLFLFYGILHKKYFWQRQMQFNLFILAISFLLSIVLTLFPVTFLGWLDPYLSSCHIAGFGVPVIARIIFTGIIISILAFLGTDFGVSLKHVSTRLQARKDMPSPKKKSKKRKS